jgi:hypothetical protein
MVKKIVREGENWIDVDQDRDNYRAVVNAAMICRAP